MAKYNERKINKFIFSKEESMKHIFDIKQEFNTIGKGSNLSVNTLDLFSCVKGIEAISNIVHLDILVLFTGVLQSIRDSVFDENLNQESYDILFEEGVKMKIPFILKKGVGTPLYYLDIAKQNIRTYEKIKEMIKKEEVDVNLTMFDYVFSNKSVRKINVSQQTFLVGYVLGLLHVKKGMGFDLFYTFLKKEYDEVHDKPNIK